MCIVYDLYPPVPPQPQQLLRIKYIVFSAPKGEPSAFLEGGCERPPGTHHRRGKSKFILTTSRAECRVPGGWRACALRSPGDITARAAS